MDTLKIGFIGLGLIGGSIAKALRASIPDLWITVYDKNKDTLIRAKEDGIANETVSAINASFSGCHYIFLCAPVSGNAENLIQLKEFLSPFCTLTDVGSVKSGIHKQIEALGLSGQFIGGHPMAGKETWGFSGSDADLFQQASMILTPDDHTPPDALALASELFRQIGFGRITLTTPEAHDRMIAFTSQLAHVVSSAYIKSPRALQRSGFSAGSYKDLTRVAKLNPEMWTELFLENGDDLVEEIDEIVLHLNEYRDAISQKDGTRLYTLLDDGRRIKEALQ